jgi:hypothetical protein
MIEAAIDAKVPLMIKAAFEEFITGPFNDFMQMVAERFDRIEKRLDILERNQAQLIKAMLHSTKRLDRHDQRHNKSERTLDIHELRLRNLSA